jgi:hypothetical protein
MELYATTVAVHDLLALQHATEDAAEHERSMNDERLSNTPSTQMIMGWSCVLCVIFCVGGLLLQAKQRSLLPTKKNGLASRRPRPSAESAPLSQPLYCYCRSARVCGVFLPGWPPTGTRQEIRRAPLRFYGLWAMGAGLHRGRAAVRCWYCILHLPHSSRGPKPV